MNTNQSSQKLAEQIFAPIEDQLSKDCKVCVAFSGGLDSRVLLELTIKKISLDRLLVIHVNHGLSAEADYWQRHVEETCDSIGVQLVTEKVTVQSAGKGLEAAARDIRYKVFDKHMSESDILLQGHHFDDQVETILYRLLRGSGAKGLAGIPKTRKLSRGILFRPLLGIKRSDLENFAKTCSLKWIEDESNKNNEFDRNFIRNNILPKITERWPDYHARFDTLIRNSRSNKRLSASIFKQDIQTLDQKQERGGHSIDIRVFSSLDRVRQKNVLLYWADSNGMQSPGHKIIREILDSLLNADEDKKSQVNFRQTQYRKYRDRVYLLDGKSFSDLEILRSQKIVWNKESRLDLDPVSHLKFDVTQGDGIRYPKKVPVIIKFRKGGERSHPSGREHSNSLKKCLQESGLEPWWRDYVPLIYFGSELVAVGDLWIQKDWEAGIKEPSLKVSWITKTL